MENSCSIFRDFSVKPKTIDYYIFSRVFHPLINMHHEFFENFPTTAQEYTEDFSQVIKYLVTGWSVYEKYKYLDLSYRNLPAVFLYIRTSGRILFRIDSPTSYQGDNIAYAQAVPLRSVFGVFPTQTSFRLF